MVVPQAGGNQDGAVIEAPDLVAQRLSHHAVALQAPDGVFHDDALRTDVAVALFLLLAQGALAHGLLRDEEVGVLHALEAVVHHHADLRWDGLHQVAAISEVLVMSPSGLAGAEHEDAPSRVAHHEVLALVAPLLAGVVPPVAPGAPGPLHGALGSVEHLVLDLGEALAELLHAADAPLR